jgi:transposase-like protein
MLGIVTDPCSPHLVVTTPARIAAADRAEQIRLGLQSTAVLYAKAVDEEDWRVLGYRSVADWAAKEFGPDRFSAERRKEIVALLTGAGLTQRKIAAATGSSAATVSRDQREQAGASRETREEDMMLVSDNQQVTENQSPRQQAAWDREAAKRAVPPAATGKAGRVPGNVGLVSVSLGMAENPFAAAAKSRLPKFPGGTVPGVPYRITDADIEQVIADNLTRGQIKRRFGVGEHAAQLARTQAMAVQRERERSQVKPPALTTQVDVAALRALAEAWLAYREGQVRTSSLGTDRTKVTLFLDWLESR